MTSVNPAAQPQDQLNDFTRLVRSLGHHRFGGWEKSGYWVQLRDGTFVRPEFKAAEDETEEDIFLAETENGRFYCWNLDGTSVTRSDYDMMEIVRND